MKYDLISDFHVENNFMNRDNRSWREGDPLCYAWHKDRKSPILVVAGDTSNSFETTKLVLLEASMYYDVVLFVDGNHDNYGCTKWVPLGKGPDGKETGYFDDISTIPEEMAKFTEFADHVDNIGYLNGGRFFIRNGVLFIGANGWYDFAVPAQASMGERVRAWRENTHDPECLNWGGNYRSDKPEGPMMWAEKQAMLLRDHVIAAQDNDEIREIVVTTHIPPIQSILLDESHPKFGHLAKSNGSYYNSHMQEVLDMDVLGKIKVWNFGHTHFRHDVTEGGVRFVCNPRGYRGERWKHGGFDGIIQVDTDDQRDSAFGSRE